MTLGDPVWILGISMTKFGRHVTLDIIDLAAQASLHALADAAVSITDVDVLAAGNLLGPPGFGQRLQKQIGQTGIPVYNVANACATGATALRTVYMAIRSGEADVGLAVGAEKLAGAGLLGNGEEVLPFDSERFTPLGRLGAVMPLDGVVGSESMPAAFSQIGLEYAYKYGEIPMDIFARISMKNHAHSTLNPLASYSHALTLEQILNDKMVSFPNTRPMCSVNCDGASAAILVSEERLRSLSPEQQRRAVKIRASVLTTDPWEEGCQVLMNPNTATRRAAERAYELAGVGPEDLDLVELHDCFATAELVHYENLMLCGEGEAVSFFESGATWRSGRMPVNVSGGLESKGHPISATGISNIWEICQHLRGEAGPRQIEGARVGLAHVLGLGTSCAVHVLSQT